jgi:hypothetical protein
VKHLYDCKTETSFCGCHVRQFAWDVAILSFGDQRDHCRACAASRRARVAEAARMPWEDAWCHYMAHKAGTALLERGFDFQGAMRCGDTVRAHKILLNIVDAGTNPLLRHLHASWCIAEGVRLGLALNGVL